MHPEPTPAQRATAALLDGVGISENESDMQAPLATETSPALLIGPSSISASTSPGAVGRRAAKRTASGAVKTDGHLYRAHIPLDTTSRRSHHTRGASTSSVTSELSSKLKTNLSYALLKVQNGWESRSLEDLEEQASRQALSLSPVRRPMYTAPSNRSSEPPHHPWASHARNRSIATLAKQQSAPEALAALVPSTPKTRPTSRPGSGAALATPSTLPGGRRAHARVRSQGLNHVGLDEYAFSPTYVSPATSTFPRPSALGDETASEGSNEDERQPQGYSLTQRTPKHVKTGSGVHFTPTRSTAAAGLGPQLMSRGSPRRNTIGSSRGSAMGAANNTAISQPGPTPAGGTLYMPQRNGASTGTEDGLGQAEQDALETLLFMRSPGNSQNIASRA
ncbi:hypothetical protein P152DRAFT_462816 [Eremomyces bilateralis CBS 781.70]|uniref:Cyclin-dependent kinase n=1 Tax=Eremomyces bilateralis CBS 781.70 TaxID=1392243 RepID=A0A6G1FR20_9PEZI|nr:uncharacterized protein P152DRAFT_462816 [Eremomyces bilateralis CBS 781.70]KAF1808160.1 hypothetical protein P152DRAFT_462816 [Eremomyces bilateralis CBS 781.70]